MKFIKLGIISLVIFGLLLTGISLLLPSTINISKAVNISAPADSVFTRINDLSRWQTWYAEYDPAQTILSANTSGKGATITLRNTKVTITSSQRPRQVAALWTSGTNASLPGSFTITAYDLSAVVTLQWLLVQKVKWYPWQKFSLLLSNNMLGPFMEKSLDNLKNELEK